MGITAQKPGKCPLCGYHFDAGTQIDRVPWNKEGPRAHVLCIQNYAHGQGQPQQQPPQQPQPPAPQTNGDSTLTQLVAMRSGIDLAIQGLGAAMVSLDALIAARGGRR